MANMAQEYADGIRESLQAWDYVSTAWTEAQDHEDTIRMADIWLRWQVRHADDPTARKLAALAVDEVADLGGFGFIEEQGGPGMAWAYGTLDAYAVTYVRPGQDPDTRYVEFVVGLGGPNAYVRQGDERSEILVYWGSDTGRAWAGCEAVDDAAEAMTDAVSYGF